jgi:50S ribosomal subunit-associated GTPase HflX
LERKLFTSRQEVFTRFYGEEIDDEFPWQSDVNSLKNHVLTVLTKADQATPAQLEEAVATVAALGLPEPYVVSSHSGSGMQNLKDAILFHLFGPQIELILLPPSQNNSRGIEGFVSDVYDAGLVTETSRLEDGTIEMTVWIHEQALARLIAHSKGRIEVK